MCHVPLLSCCFAIAVNVAKHELCELAVNYVVQFHAFVIFLTCYVSCHSVSHFIRVFVFQMSGISSCNF